MNEPTMDIQDELNRLRERAERAEAALAALVEKVWESRWVSDDPGYQDAVGTAAEIRSTNYDCGKGWLSPDAQAQLVTRMADLFLCEPLPESVCVDRCALERGWPNLIGTNLLTAVEARQMFESVFKKALRETEVGK